MSVTTKFFEDPKRNFFVKSPRTPGKVGKATLVKPGDTHQFLYEDHKVIHNVNGQQAAVLEDKKITASKLGKWVKGRVGETKNGDR